MPNWFKRRSNPEQPPTPQAEEKAREAVAAAQAAIPEGLFTHCQKCNALLYSKDFERDLKVCSKCGFHHSLTADERLAFTVDVDSFIERDTSLRATDPLTFPDYAAKLAKGEQVTGRTDTLISGTATIGNWPVGLLVSDFRFMGGSMGSVYGEKFVRCADYCLENKVPLVQFVASGGARMQEGLFGLMQMAKTSAALALLTEEKIPYIVILTNPTTGGAIASFASLGDVTFAEPGAYIAFAGARVAERAKTQKEPPNYQTTEYQHEHGKVDRIVPRKEMVNVLTRTLAFFGMTGSDTTKAREIAFVAAPESLEEKVPVLAGRTGGQN